MKFSNPLKYLCPQCGKPVELEQAGKFQGLCGPECKDAFENVTLKDPKILASIDEIEDGRHESFKWMRRYLVTQALGILLVGAFFFFQGILLVPFLRWAGGPWETFLDWTEVSSIFGVFVFFSVWLLTPFALFRGLKAVGRTTGQKRFRASLERASLLALVYLIAALTLPFILPLALQEFFTGASSRLTGLFGIFLIIWLILIPVAWALSLKNFAGTCYEMAAVVGEKKWKSVSRNLILLSELVFGTTVIFFLIWFLNKIFLEALIIPLNLE